MKKFLCTVLMITLSGLFSSILYAQTADEPTGSGDSNEPYLISSLENLYWISQNSEHWDKYYEQTENIDASASQFWNDNEGWEPIGNNDTKFTGNYNGKGYVVENLYINRLGPDGNNYQGLFGYIENTEISNLGVVNVNISGNYYVGGLTGRNDNSLINECFSSGIICGDWYVGGLSGLSSNESIIGKCYSIGEINGGRYVGGLVGYNNATLNNSYSNAGLFNSPWFSGGLVGINHEYGIINDSYSTGFVCDTGSDHGGLVGKTIEGGETNRSYWNTETSEQEESAGGEGKTTAEMMDSNTFTDWDFDDIWDIIDNDTYPFLNWQDGPGSHNYPNKHELKLIPEPEDGGTQSGAGFYLPDEIVEISANPNDGYFFRNWTGNIDYVEKLDAKTTNVTIPDYDITLTANYSPITLTIEIEPEDAGNVNVDPDKEIYFEGETVTLTANPDINLGYVFDKWSIGETVMGYEDEIEYTLPDTAVTITASFKDAFASGSGTDQYPWLVETAEHLDNVRNYTGSDHSDKHFKQIADIDLDIAPYNEGEGWDPIGNWPGYFQGTYDGDGYTISGLHIYRPDTDNQGLFGEISEGVVKNLTLTDINVTGKNKAGGIAGALMESASILNSGVSGTVSGNDNTGGVVGILSAGFEKYVRIENSLSNVMITGNERTGGLVGWAGNNSIIESSSANGTVTATGRAAGGIAGGTENALISESHSGADVIGTRSVGGLVGDSYGIIEKCYSTGTVTASDIFAGGLVGNLLSGSSVAQSYSTGNVISTGEMWAGGLAGIISGGSVTDSYSTGEVEGKSRIGGLGGQITSGTISNSYSIGKIEGTSDAGGLVGYYMDGTVENSYWNTETSWQTESAAGEGKTTVEMLMGDTFAEWNFSDTWSLVEEESYPWLQWQTEPDEHNYPELYSLTIIISPEGAGTVTGDGLRPAGGLFELSAYPDGGVVFTGWTDDQGNELSNEESFLFEMPDEDVTVNAIFDVQFAGGYGTEEEPWLIETADHLDNVRLYLEWENEDKHFQQVADIDLGTAPWIEGEGWEPIGIMAESFYGKYDGNGHIIENLYINRPEGDNVGLFGHTQSAEIINIGITDADVTGSQNVGIITGYLGENSRLAGSFSSGEVSGQNNVGGLVGNNIFNSVIEYSYSSAGAVGSSDRVGGLAGNSTNGSIIRKSFSKGYVVGIRYVGGIVGSSGHESVIENSYSTGSAVGSGDVGGLAGKFTGTSIQNSYSTGRVSGDNNFGGLAGSADNPSDIINSYWNIESSGQETSSGGEGKTTQEMISASTFTGWNFDEIWNIDEGDTYPWLAWQLVAGSHNYPADFYMLTLEADPEEGGSVEGEGELPENSLITVKATTNPGYSFVGWKDEEGNTISEEKTYYFTMPSEDITLTAVFSPIALTVNINPEDGGTIEIDPDKDVYEQYENVGLTAIPNEGYEFAGWTDQQGNILSTWETYNIQMPGEAVTITANFALKDYTLEILISPDDAGSVTIDPEKEYYNFGDEIELLAKPADGYVFFSWTGPDDEVVGTDVNMTYNMPSEDITLTAIFYPITLTVNINPEDGGIIEIDPDKDMYEQYENVGLTATPNEGYEFAAWTDEQGNILSTWETYNIQMPGEAVTITANFALKDYTLEILISPDDAGSVTIDPEREYYNFGDEIELLAEAADGYVFVNWTEDEGNVLSESASYYFSMPGEAVTITANFALKDYTLVILISPDDAGTITISPEREYYNMGDEITITASPQNDFEFICWTDAEGDEISSDAGFVFTMPGEDVVITANFDIANIIIDPSAGGLTVSPVPATDYIIVEADRLIRELRVIDVSGQVIMHVNVNAYKRELIVGSLTPGVYLLQVELEPDGEVVTRRVVVSR